MRPTTVLLSCALTLSIAPCVADGDLEQLFREHSRVMVLDDGKLSGAGLELLLAEVEDSQFLCLAEPHNSHEIPAFVTALFERLQAERAFHYLAIEQGPLIVGRIADLAGSATNGEIRKAMKKRKKALHFKTVEEVEMIADVARASTGSIQGVWGLDRVLDASSVDRWLRSPEGSDDPEASFLRERAAWSAENLAMYTSRQPRGDGPSADQHREDGFKTGFRHYYEQASSGDGPPPRVIFRFGHTHMGRLDYRSYSSLGRYLGEVAAENDLRAFYLNLQVINEPGKYWSLTDYPEYEPLANVGDPSKWVLVDLRPAREPLRSGELTASDKLKRFVFNFDAVLLMGGVSKGRKL